MTRSLNQTESKTIQQTLDFLDKLFQCADNINVSGLDSDEIDNLKEQVDDFKKKLKDGLIDIKSQKGSIQAETDSSGIHLNDTQSMYSMPGDLKLDDCGNGYFQSLWTIIGLLFHEAYHYENHTGLWGGGVKAVFDVFFGTPALLYRQFVEGKSPRSWLHKEFMAYAHSELMLLKLSFILEDVCKENPRCIPCCRQHIGSLRDVLKRHDPDTTYGA